MKKTVLASAVLLAMAGAASATPDFGTITIDLNFPAFHPLKSLQNLTLR